MTFGNEIHHQVPPVHLGDGGVHGDEFDRLLERSSVGAANAVAIQAMTPEEVVDRVQDRVPFGGRAPAGERGRDIDDVLLDLVRWAAHPPGSGQTGAVERDGPPWRPLTGGLIWHACGSARTATVIAIVRELAEANVFGYVRRDVARSIVDIAFGGAGRGQPLMYHLAHSAAPRSGLAEEVAEHLRGHPQRPVDRIQLRCADAQDLRGQVQRDLSELSRRMSATGASPVRWWDPPATETGTDPRDALVHTVIRFAIRWYSRRFAFLVRYRLAVPDVPAIDAVSGSLLGLLHSGPLSPRIVLPFVNGPLGLPHVTRAGLREELRDLYRKGLVRPATRVRANSSHTRFRLTGDGQREFRNWLLVKPGGIRGAVVLRLLRTTPFTPQQYEKLRTLSVFLDFDEEQTRDLSQWITHNLRGTSAEYSTGEHLLNGLLGPKSSRRAHVRDDPNPLVPGIPGSTDSGQRETSRLPSESRQEMIAMSLPTEDLTPVPHPVLGDLELWYQAFEAYAAVAAPDDGHFHGPHSARPVDLERLVLGLKWLEEQEPGSVRALPGLDRLRELVALGGLDAGTGTGTGVAPLHSGSACHNLWHWIHGS